MGPRHKQRSGLPCSIQERGQSDASRNGHYQRFCGPERSWLQACCSWLLADAMAMDDGGCDM